MDGVQALSVMLTRLPFPGVSLATAHTCNADSLQGGQHELCSPQSDKQNLVQKRLSNQQTTILEFLCAES